MFAAASADSIGRSAATWFPRARLDQAGGTRTLLDCQGRCKQIFSSERRPAFKSSALGLRASRRAVMATKAQAGSKTVLVPIANGSEEIEAVTIIDTMRRAGADVTVASVEDSLQVWLAPVLTPNQYTRAGESNASNRRLID